MMIQDIFAVPEFTPWSPFCNYDTDTGDNGANMGGGASDPGTTGGGYGSGTGGLEGTTSIDTGSVGAAGGFQFSGQDAKAVAGFGLELAGGVLAGGVLGAAGLGSPAVSAGIMAGLMGNELRGGNDLAVAVEHALHDMSAAIGSIGQLGDPMASGLGIFGTSAFDTAMIRDGGISTSDNVGNGLALEISGNRQFAALVPVYSGEHDGTG